MNLQHLHWKNTYWVIEGIKVDIATQFFKQVVNDKQIITS